MEVTSTICSSKQVLRTWSLLHKTLTPFHVGDADLWGYPKVQGVIRGMINRVG
jgi:hypothetical protein